MISWGTKVPDDSDSESEFVAAYTSVTALEGRQDNAQAVCVTVPSRQQDEHSTAIDSDDSDSSFPAGPPKPPSQSPGLAPSLPVTSSAQF